jgi:uncharacterized cysteine cluster protein YcgN (CxxCxxCC family)
MADNKLQAARPGNGEPQDPGGKPQAIPFWKRKTLREMSPEEWESLCDGCARCCLVKLQDEDTQELHMTNVVCRFLDIYHCRCTVYTERHQRNPDCVRLTPDLVDNLSWLPSTCAYRLVSEGKDLPEWHPLISGSQRTVHRAGISVRAKVVSESDIDEDDIDAYIIE